MTDSLGGTVSSTYNGDNDLTPRTYTGQGLNLRFDFTNNKEGWNTTLTRYSDLANTSLVATSKYQFDGAGNVTSVLSTDPNRGPPSIRSLGEVSNWRADREGAIGRAEWRQEAGSGPRYGGRSDSVRPAYPFSMVEPKITPFGRPAAGTSTWRRARRVAATPTEIVTCVVKARRQGPWGRPPMAARSGNLNPGDF